ncbi:MAG: hypothetical protein ACREBP_10635, partial [Sphingomicrobium sp.]
MTAPRKRALVTIAAIGALLIGGRVTASVSRQWQARRDAAVSLTAEMHAARRRIAAFPSMRYSLAM